MSHLKVWSRARDGHALSSFISEFVVSEAANSAFSKLRSSAEMEAVLTSLIHKKLGGVL